MKVFAVFACVLVAVAHGAPQAPANTQGAPGAPVPLIEWGKCDQLKPSDSERESKAGTVDACLKENPIPDPEKSTAESIEKHRETVTTCALKKEGWFNDNGSYKFDRARTEIVNKKLAGDIEKEVLVKHDECQKEAKEKYADNFIAQVQMYQACMDYNISNICGIKVQIPGAPTPA